MQVKIQRALIGLQKGEGGQPEPIPVDRIRPCPGGPMLDSEQRLYIKDGIKKIFPLFHKPLPL